MAVRVELCGRLTNPPALRVTPAGTAVMQMVVECGERPGDLPLAVIATGENARSLAATLKAGQAVTVRGALRTTGGRSRPSVLPELRFEVVADEIVAG